MEQPLVPTGTNAGGASPMPGVPPVGATYNPVQYAGQVPGAQTVLPGQYPMMGQPQAMYGAQQAGQPLGQAPQMQQQYPQQYAPPQPVTPVAPPPVQPVTERSQESAGQRGDELAAAEDVDVIEKEWVDRAKQVVAATRTDPHAQEQEVSKLQSDYLKKRYGKDVVVPGD